MAPGRAEGKLNLVFIDPPYYKALAKNCLRKIVLYDILSHNNFIILEHNIRDDLGEAAGFAIASRKQYGDIAITIGRLNPVRNCRSTGRTDGVSNGVKR